MAFLHQTFVVCHGTVLSGRMFVRFLSAPKGGMTNTFFSRYAVMTP